LAHTHSLLAVGDWRSASLRKIVMAEVEPYDSDKGRRIVIAGEDVQLNAQQTLVVGLALHELATNAAKYGAALGADGPGRHSGRSIPPTLEPLCSFSSKKAVTRG
jgi:two-component sensor histidine kinase